MPTGSSGLLIRLTTSAVKAPELVKLQPTNPTFRLTLTSRLTAMTGIDKELIFLMICSLPEVEMMRSLDFLLILERASRTLVSSKSLTEKISILIPE
jgi:hypothetical protein